MALSLPRIEHGLVLMLFLTALFFYILWGIVHNGEVPVVVSILLVLFFILAIAIDIIAMRWSERQMRLELERSGLDDLEAQAEVSVNEKAEGGYGTF